MLHKSRFLAERRREREGSAVLINHEERESLGTYLSWFYVKNTKKGELPEFNIQDLRCNLRGLSILARGVTFAVSIFLAQFFDSEIGAPKSVMAFP